jgi:rhamnogalacturonyl hydrolase YesR
MQIIDYIFQKVENNCSVWGNYTLDLTLDALLEIYLAGGDAKYKKYVESVMQQRKIMPGQNIPYKSQPFGHLNYNLFCAANDEQIKSAFIEESVKYFKEVSRSNDGLVLHEHKKNEPPKVLIDSFQDYAARMARTGRLTGDISFFKECAEQFQLHRNLLRSAKTGLWHQGRGWENNPEIISPGAWSRGQGWVLKGMVDSLDALPEGSKQFHEVKEYLVELIEALLKVQDKNGMWHVLPDLCYDGSAPEVSGTALVCRALYKSYSNKWSTDKNVLIAAETAFTAISKFVDGNGTVRKACAGPGPLNKSFRKKYLGDKFEECESHGRFSVLYACAAKGFN